MTNQTSPVAANGDDAELVHAMVNGSAEAFKVLYQRHAGYAMAVCMKFLPQQSDAEELVQDVFWNLWQRKMMYDSGRGKFTTWLYIIVRNRCTDLLRVGNRRSRYEKESGELQKYAASTDQNPTSTGPEQFATLDSQHSNVHKALNSLPVEQRQALEACFFRGYTQFEGVDDFAGFNVSSIVVEIPYSMLADQAGAPLQVWAETWRDDKLVKVNRRGQIRDTSRGNNYKVGKKTRHMERMGNPAINTALIPLALKDQYNRGRPINDAADFAGAIVSSLMDLGTDDENIGILASVAVPDTLKLDPLAATSYPNGRAPADDVMDTLLFFIFNQPMGGAGDGVDANDKPFPTAFPFLALPHQP